jgi:hypothetical protein
MRSDWSKFMEQVTMDYLTGVDENRVPIGGFVEVGRNASGIPVSISLPNKACSGRLALWAKKIREIKNNLLAWLRGVIRRR